MDKETPLPPAPRLEVLMIYFQYGYSDHFFSQEEMDKMYPNTLTAITNRQKGCS